MLQGYILGPTLFRLYINDLPDYVICNITIYADDTTVYSKYDQTSFSCNSMPRSGCFSLARKKIPKKKNCNELEALF